MSIQPPSKITNLSIVLPCFNEAEILEETINRIHELLLDLIAKGLISPKSTFTFVDDGSIDETWEIIQEFANNLTLMHGVKLSSNRGHQNALLAGLFNVDGDAVVTIDADLQDDISTIKDMVVAYHNGAEVVYGVRKYRGSDTFFKKFTAESYYKLMALIGVDVIFNHADYRLLSRKAIQALSLYQETNLFLRGVIPQLGFKTAEVYYSRQERIAGETKYPLIKMLSFAWIGITSFSNFPLRIVTLLGLIVSFVSFSIGIWALFVTLVLKLSLPGWASTVIPIYFLGGVQLLSLGIIGEYVAKIYSESKKRPRYIIEKEV